MYSSSIYSIGEELLFAHAVQPAPACFGANQVYAKTAARTAKRINQIHIYVLSRKHALEFVANSHQLGSGDFTHND
jgi:hypothetical protein